MEETAEELDPSILALRVQQAAGLDTVEVPSRLMSMGDYLAATVLAAMAVGMLLAATYLAACIHHRIRYRPRHGHIVTRWGVPTLYLRRRRFGIG